MKIRPLDLWLSWGKLLCGHTPLLSIELTRDCPLHCPGCYVKVRHVLVSVYSPQRGEPTPEMLTGEDRQHLAAELPAVMRRHPKLLMFDAMAGALLQPPAGPRHSRSVRGEGPS